MVRSDQSCSEFNPSSVLDQAQILCEQTFSSSAETLCHFALAFAESHHATAKQPKSTPWVARAHKILADALLQQGALQAAAAHYEQSLQSNAPQPPAPGTTNLSLHIQLCQVYWRCHNSKAALQHIAQIPESQRTLQVYRIMALASEALGNNKVAIHARKLILAKSPWALDEVTELIRLNVPWPTIAKLLPDEPWLHAHLQAHCSLYAGKPIEAIRRWQNLTSASFKQQPTLLAALGEAFACNGNYVEAMTTLVQLRHAHPTVARGLDTLARVYRHQDDTVQLCSLSNDARRNCPDSAEQWVIIAIAAQHRHQYQQAIAFANKALTIRPNYWQALLVKGEVQLQLDDPHSALAVYQHAHRLLPQFATYQGLVQSYQALDRFREALLAAKQIYDLHPNHPWAMTLMGMTLAPNTDTQAKACELLTAALAKEPQNSTALTTLASIHVALQQWDQAIDVYERHIALNHTATDHAYFADTLFLANDVLRAQVEYRAALSLDPHHLKATQGLERVQERLNQEDAPPEDESVDQDPTENDDLEAAVADPEYDLDAAVEYDDTEYEYEHVVESTTPRATQPNSAGWDWTTDQATGRSSTESQSPLLLNVTDAMLRHGSHQTPEVGALMETAAEAPPLARPLLRFRVPPVPAAAATAQPGHIPIDSNTPSTLNAAPNLQPRFTMAHRESTITPSGSNGPSWLPSSAAWSEASTDTPAVPTRLDFMAPSCPGRSQATAVGTSTGCLLDATPLAPPSLARSLLPRNETPTGYPEADLPRLASSIATLQPHLSVPTSRAFAWPTAPSYGGTGPAVDEDEYAGEDMVED
ncbi:Anaphase promoting complex subunit 7 [Dimargaris verticillata]|uniref:Anaphase promoting complex subunit 7 n=1 Tax=Dimargaris verticillata TaxID=2761393 RepID=A0A9W8ECM9_9FUNG|nr:Anaphase promoting complex subunit 7 [Dimargaris verticillata]